MNITDDDREQFEEELAELDEKTLLIQQVTELAAIRMQLQELNRKLGDGAEPEGQEARKCMDCEKQIPVDELQSHAVNQHNAPPNMSVDELGLYR